MIRWRALGGDSLPFAGRRVQHRNHIFPLHLKLGADVRVPQRVQMTGALDPRLRGDDGC